MIPLIGGCLCLFKATDDFPRSSRIFLVIFEFEIGIKCWSVALCNAEVDVDSWEDIDSLHCFGDFRPEYAVISILGLTGGIPENGRESCENDRLTWFGDLVTLVLRLVLGLNIMSPSECGRFLSILLETCKRLKEFVGFRTATDLMTLCCTQSSHRTVRTDGTEDF